MLQQYIKPKKPKKQKQYDPVTNETTEVWIYEENGADATTGEMTYIMVQETNEMVLAMYEQTANETAKPPKVSRSQSSPIDQPY